MKGKNGEKFEESVNVNFQGESQLKKEKNGNYSEVKSKKSKKN